MSEREPSEDPGGDPSAKDRSYGELTKFLREG